MVESYEYDFFAGEMTEEMLNMGFVFLGIIAVLAIIVAVFSLVMYVFQSVGLYTIAKKRGIRHAWLSWLPVGNYWMVGCIADQYRYVAKGEVKNRRKILLGLSIGGIVLSVLDSLLSSTGVEALVEQVMYSGPQAAEGIAAGTSIAGSMIISLLASVVSIVTVVFWYISLYDLYSSCNPKNDTVFLVLGIIFGFLNSIFIFVCRNKDLGMPPRKQPAPEADPDAQWQRPDTVREPWENSEE